MPEQLVPTPGGYHPASQVHHIPPGHVVDGRSGGLREIDATRKVVNDFGLLKKRPTSTPLMPSNVLRLNEALTKYPGMEVAVPPRARALAGSPDAQVPGLGTGWIVFASWNTRALVTSFTTTWVVPRAPTTHSGQLIYLFNGIQNSTMIYQPVLQWGTSPAGGGDYWAVASWYVDSQGGPAFHSDLTPVSPGTVLTGIMTLAGQSPQVTVGNNTTRSTPFVTADGWLWFQGTDNRLGKVFNDGTQQSQPGNNSTASSPVVLGETVYFQGTDNALWRMQTDGTQQSIVGGNTTAATPAPTADSLYFRGTDDQLWRYILA
jgi:hypothetical protein